MSKQTKLKSAKALDPDAAFSKAFNKIDLKDVTPGYAARELVHALWSVRGHTTEDAEAIAAYVIESVNVWLEDVKDAEADSA
jgi:hypothetical protein